MLANGWYVVHITIIELIFLLTLNKLGKRYTYTAKSMKIFY